MAEKKVAKRNKMVGKIFRSRLIVSTQFNAVQLNVDNDKEAQRRELQA